MNEFFIAGTVLLATVSALPSASSDTSAEGTPSKSWHKLGQQANFENADGVPGVAISPIGIYQDIFWQGMSLVQTTELTSKLGVVANSPHNCAAYSELDVATLLQGQPSMMTNYQDSIVGRLDLYSFFYGCALGLQVSLLGVLIACTISIKGYWNDEGNNLVAKQSFKLKPSGASTQMVKAYVDARFKGLKRVDFFVSNDAVVAALIDSVEYKVYPEEKF